MTCLWKSILNCSVSTSKNQFVFVAHFFTRALLYSTVFPPITAVCYTQLAGDFQSFSAAGNTTNSQSWFSRLTVSFTDICWQRKLFKVCCEQLSEWCTFYTADILTCSGRKSRVVTNNFNYYLTLFHFQGSCIFMLAWFGITLWPK